MLKRERTRFVGAYHEPPAPQIDLPFTVVNLSALLAEGAHSDGRYTHQQIKDWADQFWRTQFEMPTSRGVNVPPVIEKAAELAQEIEMQWDMHLSNTYTLPELQRLDFPQVHLPREWFTSWLARLCQLPSSTVPE